jgi:hypothetical protein
MQLSLNLYFISNFQVKPLNIGVFLIYQNKCSQEVLPMIQEFGGAWTLI